VPYLSTDLIYDDFHSDFYAGWLKRLGMGSVYHAKVWEQVMIYSALKKSGKLSTGNKGLGFGVGLEPLVSIFASEGAHITATDQAPEDGKDWDSDGQLAHGKDSLYYKNYVPKKLFDEHVEFQYHDMNTLEKSFINKYDFIWSNCVIGHLGSMKLSEKNLLRHARYIKYGGISVLTTEMTISSLTETVIDNSDTIIWRLSDLYRVFNDMLGVDMVANRLKLRLAKSPEDYTIFSGGLKEANDIFLGKSKAFHSKLMFSNWAITQVQIIFKKRRVSKLEKSFYKALYAYDYALNKRKLKKYMAANGDIADYKLTYETTGLDITASKLKPVTIKANAKTDITITYTNNSNKRIFSYGLNTPLHVPPVLLATANPINRTSMLYTKNWFSANRPAADFNHNSHRVLPKEKFKYKFTIKAPSKKGLYTEDFSLVLEGLGDIPKSHVKLTLNVV
jgi:hypothetical protein